MKYYFLLLLLCLCSFKAQTQDRFTPEQDTLWKTVGNAGEISGETQFSTIAVNTSGFPYILYSASDNSHRGSLIRFDGKDWVSIGDGLSSGFAWNPMLAFNPVDSYPYIAFDDWVEPFTNTIKVMKYDKTGWRLLLTDSLSRGTVAGEISIAFNKKGILYLITYANDGNLKFRMLEGNTWSSLSTAGIPLDWSPSTITLKINQEDIPFISFIRNRGSGKASVMKFTGDRWIFVGKSEFTDGYADFLSFTLDPLGVPYVAFSDEGSAGRAQVLKFNGTEWTFVGDPHISDNRVMYTNIAVSPIDGIPYVSYAEGDFGGEPVVRKFNGLTWIKCGNLSSYCENAMSTQLCFDKSGSLFLLLSDGHDLLKPIVLRNEAPPRNQSYFEPVIYANPFTESIDIYCQGAQGTSNVIIFTEEGKIIFQSHIQNPWDQIDLNRLAGGIYFLQWEFNEQMKLSKIIKY